MLRGAGARSQHRPPASEGRKDGGDESKGVSCLCHGVTTVDGTASGSQNAEEGGG